MDSSLLSLDQFTRLLEEAASQLPQEIFRDLNLGIGVVEGFKLNHRTASGTPAYILGNTGPATAWAGALCCSMVPS